MKKFKAIMLGVLSALTLGLFMAVSTKVNAKVVPDSGKGTYFDYTVSGGTATWGLVAIDNNKTISTMTDAESYGVVGIGSTAIQKNSGDPYIDLSKKTSSAIFGIYLPVPANSSGKINLTTHSSNGGKRTITLYKDGTELDTSVTPSDKTSNIEISFTSNDIYSNSNGNYIGFVNTNTGGSYKFNGMSITLTSGLSYTYALTFDANGGSCSTTSMNVEAGGKATTLPTPTYEGNTFMGWYTSVEGGTRVTTDTSITSSQTLYAHWQDNSSITYRTVTFKVNGSTYKTVENIADGTTVGSSWPSNPRLLNKAFDGWYDESDTTYNTPVTSSTEISGSNKVLVAKFNEVKNDLVVFGDYTTGLDSSTASTAAHTIVAAGVTMSGSDGKKTGSKSYTIGDVAFDGSANTSTYIQCGEVDFTLEKTTLVTFYATQANSSNTYTTSIVNVTDNANTTVYENFVFSTKASSTSSWRNVLKLVLPAGSYKTVQAGSMNWYGMRFNTNINSDAKLSVEAYQNTTKDSLRFVGTISGVAESNISSIELLLIKDGVATKKALNLTSIYTSVTGAGSYVAADNTCYVIYRITGITSTAMPNGTDISYMLIVTLKDGTVAASTLGSSEWNN